MKYPHIQQHDEKDCGAACLSMIAEYYGAKYQIAKVRNLIKVDSQGANIYGLVSGAQTIGFDADGLEGDSDELLQGVKDGEIKLPFIARIINEYGYEHFIVVYNIDEQKVVVGDPGKSSITTMKFEIFKEQWQGQIAVFVPNSGFKKINEKKGSFGKYFKYIINQKKLIVFVFIVSLIVSFINISGAVVFQYVIENAITAGSSELTEAELHDESECEEDHTGESKFIIALEHLEGKLSVIFDNLKTVCVSIIILYIFRLILNVLRGYLLAMTARQVDVPLTLDYYNHLLDLPVEFYGTRKTGEYMSRFYDAGKIRDAVSSTTLTIMLDTIMAIACGIVLFYINHKLFLITMIVMVIYGLLMFIFKNPIKYVNHELMEQEAQVTSYLKESIDGVETIKAFQCESNSKHKTYHLYNYFADINVRASVIYNVMNSLVQASESIGIVVLLWSGAALCVKNVISISDLMIFYYLINYFLDPVKNLINLQPELQTAIVAAERLNDILDAKNENISSESLVDLTGDIEIKNIDFRYGNREIVLDDVSIKFEGGKKTAIVGESGCGKTTLVKLLLKFYSPENGMILIGNNAINDLSSSTVRRKIAYVSQNIFLFSDSIYNNLRMGNDEISDEEIEKVCELCYADDFIKRLPNGYFTIIEENGNDLSGGQKQRLAIARALLRKPDILILDEATSNLDTVTEKSIKKTIDDLSSDMTCIIIAHRLNTIKNCDYIYVMDKGKVIEEGTHENLLSSDGFYAKLNLEN